MGIGTQNRPWIGSAKAAPESATRTIVIIID